MINKPNPPKNILSSKPKIERKIIVRQVNSQEQCKLFQELIQEWLLTGWRPVCTEHTETSIMIILEREKEND
jgi:hypothetical protein